MTQNDQMNTMYNMSFWIWVQLSWFGNLCHSKLWYRRNNLHLYVSGNSLTWFCTFYILFTQLEIKVSFMQANGSISLLLLQITWIENSRNSSQMQQSDATVNNVQFRYKGLRFHSLHRTFHSTNLHRMLFNHPIHSSFKSSAEMKQKQHDHWVHLLYFVFSLSLLFVTHFYLNFNFAQLIVHYLRLHFFLFADFFHLYGNFTQEKICVFFMHCRVCLQIKFFPN